MGHWDQASEGQEVGTLFHPPSTQLVKVTQCGPVGMGRQQSGPGGLCPGSRDCLSQGHRGAHLPFLPKSPTGSCPLHSLEHSRAGPGCAWHWPHSCRWGQPCHRAWPCAWHTFGIAWATGFLQTDARLCPVLAGPPQSSRWVGARPTPHWPSQGGLMNGGLSEKGHTSPQVRAPSVGPCDPLRQGFRG